MDIAQEQIEEISEAISLSEVLAYIRDHQDEYEEFVRLEIE